MGIRVAKNSSALCRSAVATQQDLLGSGRSRRAERRGAMGAAIPANRLGKPKRLLDGDVLHVLVALAMRVRRPGVFRHGTELEGLHGHLDGASGGRQSQETDHGGLSSQSNHGELDPSFAQGSGTQTRPKFGGQRSPFFTGYWQ
jgi:hypothetical protein